MTAARIPDPCPTCGYEYCKGHNATKDTPRCPVCRQYADECGGHERLGDAAADGGAGAPVDSGRLSAAREWETAVARTTAEPEALPQPGPAPVWTEDDIAGIEAGAAELVEFFGIGIAHPYTTPVKYRADLVWCDGCRAAREAEHGCYR